MCRSVKKKLKIEVEVSPIANTDINNIQDGELTTLYTYNDLKKELKNNPIDFLKLHELQMKIGNLGEAFVYEHECERLKDTGYVDRIDVTKALDPNNGYDIFSYTKEGKPLHIEVKATTGKEDTFYLSKNEYEVAEDMKNQGLIYVVYFVKEIMSNKPLLTEIWDITNNKGYEFIEKNWKVSKVKS
ncbi:DUF3883 domain-containing protein [Virgibacillus halodenitrificans]|uniref:DUF3883 domain-containing protein n=1 Tax=Virgibacillus halodenitrificans TaxID=1482 RepID=UPI00136C1071|nr:DUF3883 domain-containing protein [Virgibacillus halodenitrificans]MYL44391.1 DUF3883 domain-containing protein [Virgibacillus halodenitrificans]